MEGLGNIGLLVAFFAVMYFMLIRPQKKRQDEQAALLRSLEPGMDVITIGGLHGRIDELTDAYVDLLVTDDVVLRFKRSTIAEVVSPMPVSVPDDDVLDLADDADDGEPDGE